MYNRLEFMYDRNTREVWRKQYKYSFGQTMEEMDFNKKEDMYILIKTFKAERLLLVLYTRRLD